MVSLRRRRLLGLCSENNSGENQARHETSSSQNALAERDAALEEKEAALAERDAALVEKEAALAERDAALVEKEAALAERDAALKEKEDTLVSLKKALDEKITAMMEHQKSVEEKEAALAVMKKALDEKEATLSERDASLKDALAREKKAKQDYPDVRKLITALEMAMTAEEQKPVEEQKACMVNINDPVDEMKKLLKTFIKLF